VWSNHPHKKSKTADARHIGEKDKSSYLHNSLTDHLEIWQDDENWPSPPYRPLKIPRFKNPGWRVLEGNGISPLKSDG